MSNSKCLELPANTNCVLGSEFGLIATNSPRQVKTKDESFTGVNAAFDANPRALLMSLWPPTASIGQRQKLLFTIFPWQGATDVHYFSLSFSAFEYPDAILEASSVEDGLQQRYIGCQGISDGEIASGHAQNIATNH